MVSYSKTTIFPMLSPFNSHRGSPRLPAPIRRRHPSRPSERAPRDGGATIRGAPWHCTCLKKIVYLCIYVYMYLSIYLCIYLSIYLCIYLSIYVCMHACMYVCIIWLYNMVVHWDFIKIVEPDLKNIPWSPWSCTSSSLGTISRRSFKA